MCFLRHLLPVFLIITASVLAYLFATFGSQGSVAYAVMMAESSGNETAVSPTGDYGLMQINLAAHYSKIPGSTTDEKIQWLFNPYNNISLAKQLYDGSGWSSWNGFTSGSYQQFL